jgi:hypothetical protein
MLARHDMIRLVLVERDRLRQQTILTAMGSTVSHQSAQTGRHL